jgi:hypothetical protein
MALILNPTTGEILSTEDPTAYFQQGYREPTADELDAAARREEFGGFEAQAQAQGERVIRGATFGAVQGFGAPEDIQARADVSRELSPVTSFAADVLPDVGVAALTGGIGGLATGAGRAAGRAALAEGAGLVRAGLSAARAGGAAALAGESVGTGLVGAGQSAYAEGREFADDPGKFAEDALIWGGLNFGLGAFSLGAARKGAKVETEAAEAAGESLDDIAKAEEFRATGKAEAAVDEAAAITPEPLTESAGTPAIERARARAAQGGHVNLGDGARAREDVLDQLENVWTPEEKETAHGYTHARFYEVNDALRGGSEMTPDVQADYDRLDALFGKAVDQRATFEGTTMRGVGLTQEEAAKLDSAGILTTQGFMSSSTDEKVASQFTNFGSTADRDVPILFEIEGRTGVPIGRGQAEVVHRPGTQFAVLGKRMEGDVPVYQIREMGRAPGAPSDAVLGSVSLSDGSGFSLGDIATSPLGVGTASAAGYGAGAAIGGDQQSALGGAAAGGALGMIGAALGGRFGRAAGRASRRVEAAAVRQGEREAVEGGVERALRNASKADADHIVEQATRGAEPVREADSFGRQRRLYINRQPILEVASREMQQDLTKLVKDVGEVTRTDKLASVSAHVSDNLGAQRGVAKGIAEEAAQFAGELRAEARAYGAASGKKGMQYAIPGQKSLTMALLDNAKQVQEASTGKAIFEALDSFKRTAQDTKVALESGALNSVNPIHHQQLIPRIEAFATKIRTALEDAGTWGKAGDMQRSYNAVIHDRLLPSWKIFEDKTLQRTSKSYEGTWNVEGWENKITSLLQNKDPGARRHVGAVLDAMDELASVRRQFGDAKTAARIEDGTAKVRRTVGLADEVQDATERMKALGELVGGVPMGGAIAGGLAGGLPGAALGAALPGAVRGLVLGDLVSAYQRLSGATEAALGRGVDDWIRSSRVRGSGLGSKLRAKIPQLSDEARQLRDVAARRGVSQGMALFMGEDESPGVAFERWRDALLDQEKFFDELGTDYDALQKEDPDTFMMLAGRASLARQFLVERMPPNIAVSVANPDGYPPNREAVEDWAQYVNAVRFPTRILANMGSLTAPQVETLRTVYPRLHEQAQARLLEGIGRARAAGEPLDDTFLIRAALLFPDIDGAGSPVFSREYGSAVRDFNLQQQKQQMAGSSAPRQQQKSPFNSTVQNGATFGSFG